MTGVGTDAVTGAFGFTGRHIARLLLDSGRRVRTLTRQRRPEDPLAAQVEVLPYRFDHPVELTRSLEGVDTLYNTYWLRFEWGGATFEEAVNNSRALLQAARRAGVERIVHVSVTNPDVRSPLPYFRGKALVEREVAGTGLPFAIVRPTVVFGRGDVLVNNVAWLLRRSPLFAVPARERAPVRPVHVHDVARLCVESARSGGDAVLDAVGPELFEFREFVTAIRDAVGSRSRLVPVPTVTLPPLVKVLSRLVGDEVLTRNELSGLLAGLVAPDGPATGRIAFSSWLADDADKLGHEWASELNRHFRDGERVSAPGRPSGRRQPAC